VYGLLSFVDSPNPSPGRRPPANAGGSSRGGEEKRAARERSAEEEAAKPLGEMEARWEEWEVLVEETATREADVSSV
jgi:hypothetical protein